MHEFLEKLSDVKVLVVGDVMLDQYWWGAVNRISPEAPVPVVSLENKTTIPGGAANVAANVAGLGSNVDLIGLIGEDEEGSELTNSLNEIGVSSDYLVRTTKRPTTSKTRIIANNQQVTRVDRESSEPLDIEIEGLLLGKIESALEENDIVIISDYAKGVVSEKTSRYLIQRSREAGKKLLVDPKGKDYSKYKNATVLTPNQKEALEACGFDETNEGATEKAGEKIMIDLALDNLVITRGEKGMSLFSNTENHKQIATNARRVFDVTGAGDTVIAALATALGTDGDFRSSCEFANVAAGLVVENVGTRPISIGELREYYENLDKVEH